MEKKQRSQWNMPVRAGTLLIVCLLLMVAVSDANASGMSFSQLKAPPSKPLLPGQASATYPVGFYGLRFNTDNQNTLEIDLGAAQTAGAEITTYPDRVEVYQHSSPSVLITFHGEGFTYTGGKLVGKVTRADFVTSPLVGNITEGDVSASLKVELFGLNGAADLTNMIDANVTADVSQMYESATTASGRGYDAAAFTLNVTRINLDQTGAANLTFTVPPQWVLSHGGTDNIRIERISEKDHTTQILDTRFEGNDALGAMKFSAYSPDGTSIFGMIATKLQAEHGMTVSPGGAVMTDVGLMFWLSQITASPGILILIGAVVISCVIFFGMRRKKTG
jgi:hypothetical protein